MIIDHNCQLEFRTGGAPQCRVSLQVDTVGNLEASVTADPAELDELIELGWERADGDGELRSSWDDPVSVANPAGLVLATLQRFAVPPIATKLEITMTNVFA